jgi:Domain of unknown function (DUF4386)
VVTIKPTAAVSADRATAGNPGRPEAERRTSGLRDVPLPAAAVTAGVGLLVMAVLAFFGSAGLSSLSVAGDAAKTAQNIAGHELLYRLSVGSFLVVAVLDVVVAWAEVAPDVVEVEVAVPRLRLAEW